MPIKEPIAKYRESSHEQQKLSLSLYIYIYTYNVLMFLILWQYSKTAHDVCSYAYLKISNKLKMLGSK